MSYRLPLAHCVFASIVLLPPAAAGDEPPAPTDCPLQPTIVDEAPEELRDVKPRLWAAAFSPDGSLLATTSGWSTTTGVTD
ncbi:MAG: hypothetical protein HYS13_00585 [Planctomycetia bacterium]|nr:hypothetical protein [Planctomycetia bacterium]